MKSIVGTVGFITVCLVLFRPVVWAEEQRAVFAGGCFWCMEPPFEKLDGVSAVVSGYAGGSEKNPTYKQVSSGKTGHVEAVEIKYDSAKVSYEKLLEVFWRQIDPTDDGGQFVDRGPQYRSAVFTLTEKQKTAAEKSKKDLAGSNRFGKKSIVTEIRAFTSFYSAEDYHQDYYKKSPVRYKYYRYRSGRDQFIDSIWKKSTDKTELKKKLSEIQYKVTQEDGTEPPFKNKYWDNHRDGIYVDVVSGEPLFSSKDKYDSGTGWPSFTKPLEKKNIVAKPDIGFFGTRTEIRSVGADSHLGHVFEDGPEPTKKRFCINSAALRFVPKEKLKEEGLEEYLNGF